MNGIIVIDKPSGWTSHDAVGKLRGIFKEKRIGHGGTLDPMATGVLPIFAGRATRAAEFCENDEKEYIAGIRLGTVTDTQDITGTVLSSRSADVPENTMEDALAHFTGEQEQIPPMYSAVKMNGQKLYKLARRGVEVERKPRKINISALEILEKTEQGYIIRAVCSKGTYIRTLCHDIGAFLGCGATMSSLKRTRAGKFTLETAHTIESVAELFAKGETEKFLIPTDSLFPQYPKLTVDGECEKKCRCGSEFTAASAPNGPVRVYSATGEFLMLGSASGGRIKTIKSFFEV